MSTVVFVFLCLDNICLCRLSYLCSFVWTIFVYVDCRICVPLFGQYLSMSTVVFVFLCLRINWCYSGLKTSLYTLTVQLQKCIMHTLFLVILPVWSVRQAALVTLLLICLSALCAASFLICLSDLSIRRSHSPCS